MLCVVLELEPRASTTLAQYSPTELLPYPNSFLFLKILIHYSFSVRSWDVCRTTMRVLEMELMFGSDHCLYLLSHQMSPHTFFKWPYWLAETILVQEFDSKTKHSQLLLLVRDLSLQTVGLAQTLVGTSLILLFRFHLCLLCLLQSGVIQINFG